MTTRGVTDAVAHRAAAGARKPVHPADLRIEAWGPTREACVAEAVAAVVGSFVSPVPAPGRSIVEFDVSGPTDPELLYRVLENVVSRIRKCRQVPVTAAATATAGGLRLRCAVADTAAFLPVGAIPKGVSQRSVRCAPGPGGWWCAASIDV
jgi:SHS2 domain-containing protein